MTHLNTSSTDIYRLYNGSSKEVPPTSIYGYVDVRDLAKAHRLAYESPKAALTYAGNFTYQLSCDIIRANFSDLAQSTPEGDANKPLPDIYKYDTSKIRKDLGITFRPMEETVVESAESLRKLEERLKA